MLVLLWSLIYVYGSKQFFDYNVHCETKLYNTQNWFCGAVNMGAKSWNCSQHVVKSVQVKLVVYTVSLVHVSNEIGCYIGL